MRTVHLHARDIVRYDAVGNFVRQWYDLALAGGWRARLWAEHADRIDAYPVGSPTDFFAAIEPDDVIVFHHSIFDPVLPDIAGLPQAKVFYFHNITPPELIDPADEATARNCQDGLAQRYLAGRFDAVMANSSASGDVLLDGLCPDDRARWQGRIAAVPPIVGLDRWANALRLDEIQCVETPSAGTAYHAMGLDEDPASVALSLLFVGRLVPHKGLRLLLDVFERLADKTPELVLDIVGGPSDGAYVAAIKARAAALEGIGRGRILFHHAISDDDLLALYRRASACVTFTSHEGFCVPVLDALTFDRPMFTSALPTLLETAGGAALPVSSNADDAAGQIGAFWREPSAQASNAAARRARVEEFRALCDGHVILDVLESLRR